MTQHQDGISATVPKQTAAEEPTVRVFIPLAEEDGADINVDQTEQVILNGVVTQIRRGEYVDVKAPVFMQLKQRYPNLCRSGA